MTSPLPIEIADDAREQIAEAAMWWAKNRPSVPDAIREELDRVLVLLAVQPEIGTRARRPRLYRVRRVLLSRIDYYLYYRVAGTKLQILAFWHASRSKGPSL